MIGCLLLLYDWDARKTEETDEKIWVRFIPKNSENTAVTEGIENLFPKELFKESFYDETVTKKGGRWTGHKTGTE